MTGRENYPRRHNFQTIAWFNDLRQRGLLDLDPPYQRRSVWSQRFKDYFVETVLLNYPAPAIFLYEDISPEGRSIHHVVDGKQRLTTLFEFIDDVFPVAENSAVASLSDRYFSGLPDETKKAFWGYQFLVEYVPEDDEGKRPRFDVFSGPRERLTLRPVISGGSRSWRRLSGTRRGVSDSGRPTSRLGSHPSRRNRPFAKRIA
jgi:hypothetical protein